MAGPLRSMEKDVFPWGEDNPIMNKLIVSCPEVRFEHCFTANGLESATGPDDTTGAPVRMAGAYDNGTRQSQTTFLCDITWHF